MHAHVPVGRAQRARYPMAQSTPNYRWSDGTKSVKVLTVDLPGVRIGDIGLSVDLKKIYVAARRSPPTIRSAPAILPPSVAGELGLDVEIEVEDSTTPTQAIATSETKPRANPFFRFPGESSLVDLPALIPPDTLNHEEMEKNVLRYSLEVDMPYAPNTEEVTSTYADGVLTVRVPCLPDAMRPVPVRAP